MADEDYDFSAAVTKDITLVAQWEPVTTTKPETGYTVNTTVQNHTYEIYQIFTGDYTEMTEGEGETQTKKDILTNIVWGENGTGTTGQKVDDETLKKLYGVVDKPLNDDKLKEIEAIVTLSNPIQTIEVNGSNPASVTLPAGYYLIKDKDGSQSGKEDAYTTYITVVVKDYTVQPKSALPTVDKQVFDNDEADETSTKNTSNKNPGSGWYETADHAINHSFQFRLIATIPAPQEGEYNRFDDYESYQLVFRDTMSKGITFESIESVTVGEVSIPVHSDSAPFGYVKSDIVTGEGEAQSWSLTIPDLKKYDDMKSGAEIIVTYNAHLNADAIKFNASTEESGTDAVNKNSVYLEFSNNPNTGHSDEMGKTEADHVWVFTYQLNNTKYADEAKEGNELDGAKFSIKDSNGTVIKLIDNGDGTYTVANQEATEGVAEEMTSNSGGKFYVIGLDAGTYTLTETKAPAGYNAVADQTITIEATHKETDGTDKAALTLNDKSTMTINVVDQSGAVLPSTGGMGTKLFYLLGAILVIGAGVTLLTRRRMGME